MTRRILAALTALALLPLMAAADWPHGWPVKDPPQVRSIWKERPVQRVEHAVAQGKLDLRLRSFFIERDFDNAPRERSLALGGWLRYRTADFHGLRAGVTLATAQPFGYEDPAEGGGGVLPPDQSGITVFSEAYLLATLGQTKFQVFRQALNTPFLDHEDDRLIPTTYEAYGLRNRSLLHTELEMFYVNGIKLQSSDTFQSMTEAAGISGEDNGLFYAGGKYSPENGIFVEGYNYYCTDYMNTLYFEADYAVALPRGFTLTPAVQYIDQRSVGDQLGGKFNTYAWGAKAQVDWHGLSALLSFHSVSDDADMQQPWADYPGFNSMIELNNFLAGLDSAMAAVGWQKDWSGLGEINAWVYYSKGWASARPGSSDPGQRELDVIIHLKPAITPGLTFTVKYADVDQDQALGGQEFQDVRLLLDWRFNLL